MADRNRDWQRQRQRQNQQQWSYDRDYDRDQWQGRDYSPERQSQDTGSQDLDRNYSSDYGYEPDYNYGRGYDYDRDNDYGRRSGRNYGSNRASQDDYDYDWENDYAPATWTYTEWWLLPGPFTGMGPQGYQRSDQAIREDVCERLTQHGHIDASDMDVAVQDGEVTLKGSVDNRRMKRMAEDLAESVSGVQDVHNELHIKQRAQRQMRSAQEQDQTRERMGSMQGQSGRGQMSSRVRDQIREGMEVVGADRDKVGTVKEVRSNDFLVDRSMARDVYVPFSACQSVSGNEVTLAIKADEVDKQNWPNPQIVETPPPVKGEYRP